MGKGEFQKHFLCRFPYQASGNEDLLHARHWVRHTRHHARWTSKREQRNTTAWQTLTLKPICTGWREPLVSWGGFGMARKHQRHSRLQIPSKGGISRTGNGKVILEGIWKGRGLSKDITGPEHELSPCVHSTDVIQ